MFKNCTLCPRNCGVDRTGFERGFCGSGDKTAIARASLHKWEEPCISGENGSGTVFFSGCSLGCVYCQNRKISCGETGKRVSEEELCDIFLRLQENKAENINLVTPTHFVPHIIASLEAAKKKGLKLPVVYNTSGYEKVETLKMLGGLIDIYLPDFKYYSSELARKYSRAPDYPQAAKAALREMVRQTGAPVFDENGMMKSGVIVRHLLLPGYEKDSERIIEYLFKTYGNDIYISIMSQFTPLENVKAYPEINRKVTKKEYDRLLDFAIGLGVENAFIQEGDAADESFIPDFDLSGV